MADKANAAPDEKTVERVAEALWNARSHDLLAKAGYATDWASQPSSIKRGLYKEARAAIAAALIGDQS